MGCITIKTKRVPRQSISQPQRLKTKEITITPGTFVRIQQSFQYDNYKELMKIGSGAFAEVVLCEYLPTNTQRAVKKVHKSGLSTQQRDPICKLKEIQILKTLDHPNILKCYEIFEDENKYYVATEYCSGGDLFAEILKLKKFTESKAAEIMFQLLSALTYCHEKKVIHRDLKPENILLLGEKDNFTIKVADFGSSCILDKEHRLNGCFGSAYYIAPEVLSNNYNEKCDIWSLGIIMYILLTGRPPYSGKDTETILQQVKECPLIITPFKVLGLSSESVNLLQMLLRVSPESRISAREAVSHPWIAKYRNSSDENSIEIILQNLRIFNCESKLKEAVHIFLASQVISNQEINSIRQHFQLLDKDGDGKITSEELMAEYKKAMSVDEAKIVVEDILLKLDQDQDGNIDYTEFLISCYDQQRVLSQEYLEIAFKMFDTDGSGTITVDEIRQTLENGQFAEEEAWEMVLQEADSNGDGCIDLKEFIALMHNMQNIPVAHVVEKN
ncbi:hypothetical protein SteCoe_11238 [Stentor coeruleus]|uniref:non-specific serine/threonine protein kinase n=1 Tax=Stentor coeruleus TaxID=5963 RepID=A0A1R2CDQ1_9CILI|nr:hypothetical protein SteCoe_11238 [Stentor coeruleus]